MARVARIARGKSKTMNTAQMNKILLFLVEQHIRDKFGEKHVDAFNGIRKEKGLEEALEYLETWEQHPSTKKK